MTIRKYKYYFRKPKSAIIQDILKLLAIGGAIYIAAGSPYFIRMLLKKYSQLGKYPNKKISNAFSRLRKQGCLQFQAVNHQIYISLTEKGKRKAGWMQIDDLEIAKQKKWDKKWRLVIFDIAQIKKIYREAFRGKLKILGFRSLQKSVWVHPYECQAEIELLKDFFGLSDKELRLIVAQSIGIDEELKKEFRLQ